MGAKARPVNQPEPVVLTLADLEDAIMHRDDLARLLGLRSAQMLDVHARENHLVRADQRGFFKLAASITRLAEHQRSVAAKHSSQDGKHDVAAESAQLKAAQRRLTELKIAKEQGDLIATSELLELWGNLVRDVRAMMLSMPARVQGELPHLVASEVETLKRLARAMLAELTALGNAPPRPA